MTDDRAPKCSQKENRPRVRVSGDQLTATPLSETADQPKCSQRDSRTPKRKVVPTLTRTNASMNNRVILFREPIRLSVAQKVWVSATEEREREKKRQTGRSESGDTREEKRTKKREELHRPSWNCFSRNSRAVTALGFSLLQDLRQDGGNLEAVSRTVDARICDQLMPTSL